MKSFCSVQSENMEFSFLQRTAFGALLNAYQTDTNFSLILFFGKVFGGKWCPFVVPNKCRRADLQTCRLLALWIFSFQELHNKMI